MNTLKLIFVLIISFLLFSCSNSAKKDAPKNEATPIDTIQTIQKSPERQDSVAVIKNIEEKEKSVSTSTDVSVSKQAEQVKTPVHGKDYGIHKPVKPINKEALITKTSEDKAIAHSESPVSGIKHATPPPSPSSGSVVLLSQQTAESHNEEAISADTLSVSAENSSSEPPPSPAPENSVPKKKSARLAYNYSSEMKRDVSEDINVYVSIVNSGSFVKDTLMKIVAQQKNPNNHKTKADSIVCANILLYKRIKVELIDPESSFKIDSVYGNAWQDVDSIGDNRWRWSVIPLTNHPMAKLVIKVVAKTPAGAVEDIDDRTFYIKVKMTGWMQMLRDWWIYLQDHPELVVTVILIPVIAYFGKRYFDRKSKEQKP